MKTGKTAKKSTIFEKFLIPKYNITFDISNSKLSQFYISMFLHIDIIINQKNIDSLFSLNKMTDLTKIAITHYLKKT